MWNMNDFIIVEYEKGKFGWTIESSLLEDLKHSRVSLVKAIFDQENSALILCDIDDQENLILFDVEEFFEKCLPKWSLTKYAIHKMGKANSYLWLCDTSYPASRKEHNIILPKLGFKEQ